MRTIVRTITILFFFALALPQQMSACDSTWAITIDAPVDLGGGNFEVGIEVCMGDGGSETGFTSTFPGFNVLSFAPASLTNAGNGNTAVGSSSGNSVTYFYPGNGAVVDVFVEQFTNTCFNYSVVLDGDPSGVTVDFSGINCLDINCPGSCSVFTEGNDGSAPVPGSQSLGCGQTFTDTGGSGGNYTNNADETYVICPDDPADPVTLDFSVFDIESGFDNLLIYDNSTASGSSTNYTGTGSPGTVTATNPTGCLTVVFTSDGSVTSTGWVADIICGTPPPVTPDLTCGDTFTDTGGNGGNYNNNANESYLVCSDDPATPVTLNFSEFSVENGFDNLTIYDNNTATGSGTTFTGAVSPGSITSTNPTGCLTVVFTSDGSVTDIGWVAGVICGNDPQPCVAGDECETPFPITGNTFETQQCIVGCNTGSTVGPDFTNTNDCFDFLTPTVWYSVTTSNGEALAQIEVTSTDLDNPQVAVFSTTDCITYVQEGCVVGAGGLAAFNSSIQTNSTFLIAVSDNNGLEGDFDLCVTTLPDNTLCNVDNVLFEQSSSNPLSPVGGPYLPGETVEFCYTINQYMKENCNWLQGIVPTFGDCWDASSFDADGMPTVTTALANAGVAPGFWGWQPDGAVQYNNLGGGGSLPDGTDVGGGWFFVYTDQHPSDPNQTWGDGGAGGDPADCDINGNGYTWTVCFELLAGTSACSLGETDCGLSIKTYADGEIGLWTDLGCTEDLPTTLNAFLECCIVPVEITTSATGLSCDTTSITLTADAGYDQYDWSTGGTTQSIDITTPGTYTVTVTIASNGCTNTQSVTIGENTSSLNPAITPSATELTCTVTSIILTADAGYDVYAWSNGQNTPTATVNTAGNYTVTVTDTANGCTGTAMITITGDSTVPNPMITASANELTCDVTSITLEASTHDAYLWSNGEITQTATVTTAGTYTVIVTNNSNGCTASTSVTITENTTPPTPSITPSATELNCTVTSITLDAGMGYSAYEWSNGETTQIATVTAAGDYTVTVTDASNGCTNTAMISITQDPSTPNPMITASANELTCAVTSIILTADAGYDAYEWSSGEMTQGINVTMPGTYDVTVTDSGNGCTAITSIEIMEDTTPPIPTITPSATELNCTVTSITLDAGAGYSAYEWSNGETTQIATVTAAGDYTITVTDASNGCTGTAMISITTDSTIPNPMITSSAPELTCAVTSIILTADAGYDVYVWSNGETTQMATVTTVGTYTVIVTDNSNGCTATASIEILENTTPPSPSITPSATELNCTITSITLDAGAGYSAYEWSNGETTQIATVTAAGDYTVTVTDASNGCTNTAMISITQDPSTPNPMITASANELTCAVTSIILTADAGYDAYEWSSGEMTQGINVTMPGTYDVTVTDSGNGCTAITSVTITENLAIDMPVITPSATELTCDLTVISLEVQDAFSAYEWSTDATSPNIDVTTAGDYTVTVTNATNGCTATASITITEDVAAPTVAVTPSATELGCMVNTITLDAAGTGVSYEWDNGSTDASITISAPGDYSVTTTAANGCTASAVVTITQDPAAPNAMIMPSDLALTCDVSSITLDAGAGYDSYIWSTGETTQTITINAPGDYSVTITQGMCTDVDMIAIEESLLINVAITGDNAICSGESSLLDAGAGFDTYSWSDGSFGQTLSVDVPGTYTVAVTSGVCSGTAEFVVSGLVSPSPIIMGDNVICQGETTSLDAGDSFASYIWEDGSTDQIFITGMAGDYTVTVTNVDGCQGTAMFTVSMGEVPALNTIGETTICGSGSVVLNNSASSNTSYNWTATPADPSLTDPTAGAFSVSPSQTTTYTVTATSNDGCSTTEIVVVNVEDPQISVTSPVAICPGDATTLSATVTPAGAGTVTWMDWQGNMVGTGESIQVSPGASTSYLALYEIGSCSVSAVVEVMVEDWVNANAFATPGGAVNANTEVTLTTTGAPEGSVYEWSASTGDFFANDDVTTASPVETTTYTVTITTPQGCVYTASVTVEVNIIELDIPNAFTPNGDDSNDTFFPIYEPTTTEIIEFKVFDRWGAVVYDNAGLPWDGTYRNRPMPSDIYVYFFRVRYADGSEGFFKGDVALMR